MVRETFQQLITTPFRVETNIPAHLLPVYSAQTPAVPPYTPYRKISYYPHYSSYRQLKAVLPPKNLLL